MEQAAPAHVTPVQHERHAAVAALPGLIAFWSFQRADADGWTSRYDPRVIDRGHVLRLRRIGDASSYAPSAWPYDAEAERLELRGEGPFGAAIRLNQGYIYGEVARSSFDGGPLDLHGRRPFTLIAWTSFIGKRHMVAGIWDEGGWDRYAGRRQAALFGGLFGSQGVIAHLSATGAASYPQSTEPGSQYARMKAMDGGAFADRTWVCMAMTYDGRGLVDAWLDGVRTPFSYRDAVAASVSGVDEPQPINPAAFPHPIYSPRAFLIKFNGYDRSTGVAEHRLHLDLDAGSAVYARTPATAPGRWRITADLERGGAAVPGAATAWEVEPEVAKAVPGLVQARLGDAVALALWRAEGSAWTQVGTTIRRTLSAGAPFTFGRALGLGSEDPGHGSQLLLGGVAVVDRVLAASELRALSFAGAR